jgi:hypothetical protein
MPRCVPVSRREDPHRAWQRAGLREPGYRGLRPDTSHKPSRSNGAFLVTTHRRIGFLPLQSSENAPVQRRRSKRKPRRVPCGKTCGGSGGSDRSSGQSHTRARASNYPSPFPQSRIEHLASSPRAPPAAMLFEAAFGRPAKSSPLMICEPSGAPLSIRRKNASRSTF